MIRVRCRACRKVLYVADDIEGMPIRCECGAALVVPARWMWRALQGAFIGLFVGISGWLVFLCAGLTERVAGFFGQGPGGLVGVDTHPQLYVLSIMVGTGMIVGAAGGILYSLTRKVQ
jgi:hypothetical protein